MLPRALKMAFWVVYDHLGKLLLANLASSFLCALPVALALAAAPHFSGAAALVFFSAAAVLASMAVFSCAAALAWMVRGFIETRDGTVSLFFAGLRKFAPRGGALGLCYLFAGLCLLSSVWFYASRVGAAHPVIGYGLSAMALWSGVFLGLTALAAPSAMVQRDLGPAGAVKLAAVLVLDNPLFFAGLAVCSALMAAAAVLAPVLLVCFFLAPLVALHGAAYEMLARGYAAEAAARASGTAAPGGRGRARVDFDDANDDYLNRGLRDLIFPWKG